MAKQWSNGLKRSVYWSNYQSIPAKVINQGTNTCESLSASFQSVKRLFVPPYAIAGNTEYNEAGIKDNRNYFLPRGKIENYIILIDVRNFYD